MRRGWGQITAGAVVAAWTTAGQRSAACGAAASRGGTTVRHGASHGCYERWGQRVHRGYGFTRGHATHCGAATFITAHIDLVIIDGRNRPARLPSRSTGCRVHSSKRPSVLTAILDLVMVIMLVTTFLLIGVAPSIVWLAHGAHAGAAGEPVVANNGRRPCRQRQRCTVHAHRVVVVATMVAAPRR